MIWRFDEFELDEDRFELRRSGSSVRIAPKPLHLLIHLAKRQPAAVSHEELLRSVWPGVRVTNASLARAVLAARHALGDGKADEGAFRTIRGRGYALVISSSTESPTPGGVAPYIDAPFIGRHPQLARIEAALDHVQVGRGRLLFITGEPGIGKSRLLGELASRAMSRGALVVTGQCREDDGAPPYWPWPEVILDLARQCGDQRVRSLLDEALVDLEPDRPEAPKRGEARASLTDADARFRLFQTVTDALRQAANVRMLVVLLEDLHWARAGALRLLRFVGLSSSKTSTLIAMTFRSSGPPPNPVLETTTGELAALGHAAPPLHLLGFSREEVDAYIRQTTGRTLDSDLVGRLHDAAGGNPLFVRELAPFFRAQDEHGGERERIASPTMTHVLRSQIGRLGRAARDLVEIASVIGRSFNVQLLSRVTGRKAATVIDLLEEARGENLIDGEGSEGFRFRHDVIRTALVDQLRASRRIDLHRRVAEAIESGGNIGGQLAQLAYHYCEAVPRAGRTKAVHYATRAAEAARQALDFDRAAQHYRQALAALGDDTSTDTAERCDLLLGLGEVLELAGQLTQSREAILEAAGIARRMRSISRLGRAALALTAWQQIDFIDPEATELIEHALQTIGRRRTPQRARLVGRLAVLRRVEGHEAEAARLVGEAFALAKQLRDLPLRCDIQLQRLFLAQFGVPRDRATPDFALSDELLSLAEPVRNTYAILQCRRYRISLLLNSGAGVALDEEIERFARESTAARSKQQYLAGFRTMRAIVCGRFEEAIEMIDEIERLADPSPDSQIGSLGHRIDLPAEHRDSKAVARAIDRMIREFPQVVGFHAARAMVALDLGDLETARTSLERFAADGFDMRRNNMGSLVTLTALSVTACRLGDRRYAQPLYDLLLPHSGAQSTAGLGVLYQGPVDWYLGLLATMEERPRQAAHHFKTALATTERLGAWPWHARTEVAYASLLAEGNAGERKRARALAASASEAAARFGMHSLGAEAKQVLASLGARRKGSSRKRNDR